MKILGFILGLPGRIKTLVVSALVGALALLTLRAKWRREGRDEVRLKAVKEAARRVAKGAKGAEQARQAQVEGRTPEDGVRSRDKRWRR